MIDVTPYELRCLAVTSQQLATHPFKPDMAGIMSVMRRIGCVQLDPIRAVERSPLLALWSRVGEYDVESLNQLLWVERSLFEYWAHAASIVLTENFQIHHGRMRRYATGNQTNAIRTRAWLRNNRAFADHILQRLAEEGPLFASAIENQVLVPWESSGWTNDQNVRQMLGLLWHRGDITVAERQGRKRKWGLMADCLPQASQAPLLDYREIDRRAAQLSLKALGIATSQQIANHFIRGQYVALDETLGDLQAEKTVLPVRVINDGVCWPGEWVIHADSVQLLEDVRAGRWQGRTTLLSPFDNLISDRDRTERLWDFHFRIEIYVPAKKRKHGYYVMPILHNEQLIGRIDPRMDRRKGIFTIHNVYAEPDAPPEAGKDVALAIRDLARFVGAGKVLVQKAPQMWQSALATAEVIIL